MTRRRIQSLAPVIAPCRCGRAPKLRRIRGEYHVVCSGTCDGVWAEGPVLATVAADWAAQQVGADRRAGVAHG